MRPGGNRFEFRASSFFRHSSFGFRHCPDPRHAGCYDFMNDIKFAFRQLLKNPGFTAVAVLTLALGIGANTAIFSVVNAVMFRRLPFPSADRLVLIGETNARGEGDAVAPANFLDWKEQGRLFEEMGAKVDWGGYELTGDPEPEQVIGAPASAGVFKLLEVRPLLGRIFALDEDQPGGPPVVL